MRTRVTSTQAAAAAAVVVAVWCATPRSGAGAELDPPIRLQVEALLQEGGLLRDELEKLSAPAQTLAAEGAQLDAEEQSLRGASSALNEDIQAFNAALGDLEKAARDQQLRCPRESQDAAVVEACNTEAAAIRKQAQQRDAQRPALQQRQQDLNARIERHNAARQDWAGRKSQLDARLELNRHDLGTWLERAQRFFATADFAAAYLAANKPAACRPEGLRDLADAPAAATLQRALGCLQALQPGS